MKLKKEEFTLEKGLEREWLITNGVGGFACSTIIGTNTRKYHGLLIAPLTPPARRFLVLSKVDESIEINGNKYDLYTNIGKNYTSQGFKYQVGFEKEYVPTFSYEVNGVKIKKSICMQYGKNTVGVCYKIKNGNKKAKLNLAPIVNFRDFHTMNTNHEFKLKQDVNENRVKIIIDGNENVPVYMSVSCGKYFEHQNDTFYNMFYIEEEKRGFFPEENHAVTGVFEIEIEPNEEKEISFVCSIEENLENVSVSEMIKKETARINKIIDKSELLKEAPEAKSLNNSEKQLIKQFIIATDNFIVNRPAFNLHTIIAGYPWFLDWGRDSLISFEGLLLVTKRFDIAREVLLTCVKDIKDGLVPNGYSGYDNRPLYNSVDASLLLFEQVKKYIDYTGDDDFVKKNLYTRLENIMESYIDGIDLDDNNIYVDADGLLVSGTEYTQNTWMDAKYNNYSVTPRNGKAVEINAMWYNAQMIMSSLSKKYGRTDLYKKYSKLAEKTKISFNNKFYNSKRKCLYDVLGDSKIRPNQLFALSLSYPVIEPSSEVAKNLFGVVTKKLLNSYGLKTLAKGEENYIEVYDGDSFKRDMSYHQGITWTWLLGVYYDALKNMIKAEKNKKERAALEESLNNFIQDVTKTFTAEISQRGCIGSIAEIYDSKKPYLPKGAIAQAWSVAEVFRIILKI